MVARVLEGCKGMLGMKIAWFACQLRVPHSTVLPDWELKLELAD